MDGFERADLPSPLGNANGLPVVVAQVEENHTVDGSAHATVDLAGQNALLGQVQDVVWTDAPYVWLHVNENVTAIRKGIKGVEVWPIVFTIPRRASV